MSSLLPKSVQELYPFQSHFLKTSQGYRLHYIDEGNDHLTLFLHDLPLWSFFYRNLILDLRKYFRCVAFDYLGFGLSDKPKNIDYNFQLMVDNTIDVLKTIKAGKFNLVLHGWGGVPGMAIAERWPERVNRIILMNANCFPDFTYPMEYSFYQPSLMGSFLVKGLNLPVLKSAFGMPVGSASRRGYRFPYSSWSEREPFQNFISHLPVSDDDSESAFLKNISEKIYILTHKHVLALWGKKDPLFSSNILEHWREEFNNIKVHELAYAGHNALESDYETLYPLIRSFLMQGIEAKLPTF